jgi:hypothetical protein
MKSHLFALDTVYDSCGYFACIGYSFSRKYRQFRISELRFRILILHVSLIFKKFPQPGRLFAIVNFWCS